MKSVSCEMEIDSPSAEEAARAFVDVITKGEAFPLLVFVSDHEGKAESVTLTEAPRTEARPIVKYPLRAFLDLSTAHLSTATRDWMDARAAETARGDMPSHCVSPTAYGWFVYVDEEPSEEDFPADLIACMAKAREMGAEYIMFDADGAQEPGLLPVFPD